MAADRAMISRVFTIAPGVDFLGHLARAILAGDLPRPGGTPRSPLALADVTILLPTRRAARALAAAFLAHAERKALVLPRIRPIAEADEDEGLIAGLARGLARDDLTMPPAFDEIERRLVLVSLIERWSAAMRAAAPDATATVGGTSAAQAAHLAGELAKLMDQIETENVSLAGLAELVPDDLSAHWQTTLDFLKIVSDWWPAHLAETGRISPADRRNRLILAEARRLAEAPPSGPVIVAGVTGSIPATAELMRAVLALDEGAVVLPGLDLALDEESFALVATDHPEHPQHGLARLIETLGVARTDIAAVPATDAAPAAAARTRLVAEALRPASRIELWQHTIATADRGAVATALEGVSLVTAPTPQDEAETVALVLREAAETPGRTAALVTPDRLLGRRVAVRLESWGIRVDDSAGRPFRKTPPGAFVDLVLDAETTGFKPVAVMALLKHPLTRLGLETADVRRRARALEIAAFRTVYLGRGLDGLVAALDKARVDVKARLRRDAAVTRLWDEDWDRAEDLATRLMGAFEPLDALYRTAARVPLQTLVAALVHVAEALAATPAGDEPRAPAVEPDAAQPLLPMWQGGEPSRLWSGEAGETGALMFARLMEPSLPSLDLAPDAFADFYRALTVDETVRPRVPVHPRISIWGPFEARLQRPDVVVLGSLNEGTWPQTTDPGPWLSRPMRKALGLPSPEQTIGYAAHDVTGLLGAPTVIMTRAEKVDGVPTVASRWLLRLEALLAGLGVSHALAPERNWAGWARHRDHIARRIVIPPPEPRPPLHLRPTALSVSDVERWIQNPYALYARRILRLDPIAELGADPNAALKGSIVHEALGRFAKAFPKQLPDDTAAALIAIARDVIEEYTGHPTVAAFWLPRLERFAHWFGDTEPARRQGIVETRAEVTGRAIIATDDGAASLALSARADRLDLSRTGLVITDYKTAAGIAALKSRAGRLESPQLPLEAAIALAAGFPATPSNVEGLRYISTAGGDPAGEERLLDADPNQLGAAARAGLVRLISAFADEQTAYRAVRRARFDYRYDDYAHLARVGEWAVEEPEDAT